MDLLPAHVTARIVDQLSVSDKFYFRAVSKSWDRGICASRLRTLSLFGSVSDVRDQRRKLSLATAMFGEHLERLFLPETLDERTADLLVRDCPNLRFLMAPGWEVCRVVPLLPSIRSVTLLQLGNKHWCPKDLHAVLARTRAPDNVRLCTLFNLAALEIDVDLAFVIDAADATAILRKWSGPAQLKGLNLRYKDDGGSNVFSDLASRCRDSLARICIHAHARVPLTPRWYGNIKVLSLVSWTYKNLRFLELLFDAIGPQIEELHLFINNYDSYRYRKTLFYPIRKLVNVQRLFLTGSRVRDPAILRHCAGSLRILWAQPADLTQFVSCLCLRHPFLRDLRIPRREEMDENFSSDLLEQLLRGLPCLEALSVLGRIVTPGQESLGLLLRLGTRLRFLECWSCWAVDQIRWFAEERAAMIRNGAPLAQLWLPLYTEDKPIGDYISDAPLIRRARIHRYQEHCHFKSGNEVYEQ